ncbi:2-dehydro-3-deoxygluconokinase [Robbsia andropogonis]|uniref:2-dehydro-3-deoxygluconokinase n=1 Tax=Robbsia andropogonis TaxID=28092 RepID=A0A0F5JVN8_9BURK|nr:sugar kinase [Robbsia andropogonis]KKB61928.1 2-dehydro-3-deoxygluconokinase [Robbsia andropogonis]
MCPANTTQSLHDGPIDFLTYGEAMTLFIAETPGDLALVERFSRRVAGADLNVAIGLSRLGYRVGYLSRVGKDSFGRHVLATLAQEHIDSTCVTVDERYRTGFQLKEKALQGADPITEYFRKGSAASHLSEADFDIAYIARAQALHLTGIAPAISETSRALAFKLAKHFRETGKPISFDPNLRPSLWPSEHVMIDTMNQLADLADWILPGIGEGKLLTGAKTPEGIADFYLKRGATGVVVKLGEKGAFYASAAGASGYVDAVPVTEVVDTVGAGDGFAVGVISALAAGKSPREAALRGALIGALQVQVVGDSEGLPTAEQLARLEHDQAA